MAKKITVKPISNQIVDFKKKEELSNIFENLSNDDNELFREILKLTQRTRQSFWLIGQRYYKLKKLYHDNPIGESFESYCQSFKLPYSSSRIYEFINLYKTIEFKDLENMPADTSKQLEIAKIKDSEKRKKIIQICYFNKRDNGLEMTLSQLKKEIKSINFENSTRVEKHKEKYNLMNDLNKNSKLKDLLIRLFDDEQLFFHEHSNELRLIIESLINDRMVDSGK